MIHAVPRLRMTMVNAGPSLEVKKVDAGPKLIMRRVNMVPGTITRMDVNEAGHLGSRMVHAVPRSRMIMV